MTEPVRPYRWLASHYDEVFAGFRRPIDAARQRVLGRILPHVGSACDLACGTGTTAIALAARGIKMYAVDNSRPMCRLTREKAAQQRLAVRVLCADMRSFRLPERVGLVTCECDALNHVPRKSDLRRVADAVCRALQPGGYFFFDVNKTAGFERYWTGTVCVEKRGLVLMMRNGHSRKADRAWSDLDWFVQDGAGWRRYRERVEEVCWTEREVRSTLRQAGFGRVLSWDAAPFFPKNSPVGPGCRTVYLACRA